MYIEENFKYSLDNYVVKVQVFMNLILIYFHYWLVPKQHKRNCQIMLMIDLKCLELSDDFRINKMQLLTLD